MKGLVTLWLCADSCRLSNLLFPEAQLYDLNRASVQPETFGVVWGFCGSCCFVRVQTCTLLHARVQVRSPPESATIEAGERPWTGGVCGVSARTPTQI